MFTVVPFIWLLSVAGGLVIIGSVYAWVSEPV